MAAVFTDNFAGTVNTPLNGRVASGGGTWQGFGVATADIAGLKINAANQVKIASTTGCLARAETGVSDHYARGTILTLTPAAAIAVRATDHLNFIGLRVVNVGSVELFKRIAGVETSIVKVSGLTLSVPASVQATMVGTTATLFVNGAPVGLAGGYTISDAVFAGVTKTGLWGKASLLDPVAGSFEGGAALTALVAARGRSGLTDRGVAATGVGGAAVALAVARGRSGIVDRAVAVGVGFGIAPARGRSGPMDRGAALGAAYALAPGGSRLAQIGRPGALAKALPLAPASARSSAIDRGAGLAASAPLLAARARHGLATRGAGVAWTAPLAPAGSWLAGRVGPGGLGMILPVAPAGARHAGRAGAPGLAATIRLVPDGGRLAERVAAGAATVFAHRTITPVVAEIRTIPVRHD